ncbi:hypothetical protein JDV02_009913 [Purpureocillium takamizusanense]|uniref:Uncharacterized protein n=1 Tax=Purpureocillium takamizusanense TaxID=2060973 RepID=A0A9Q8VEP9_9HYPO|nr:uncharacterized protein JDV02_009913 [Purpureocillium takamizusanense]UNI24140.1 hypothetical protein JDV02_009913 [Purpureocillium takamizusanense]
MAPPKKTTSHRRNLLVAGLARLWKPRTPTHTVRQVKDLADDIRQGVENIRTAATDRAELMGYTADGTAELKKLVEEVEGLKTDIQRLDDGDDDDDQMEGLGPDRYNALLTQSQSQMQSRDDLDGTRTDSSSRREARVAQALADWVAQSEGTAPSCFSALRAVLTPDAAQALSDALRPTVPATQEAVDDTIDALREMVSERDEDKERLQEQLSEANQALSTARAAADTAAVELQSVAMKARETEASLGAEMELLERRARDDADAYEEQLRRARDKVSELEGSVDRKDEEIRLLREAARTTDQGTELTDKMSELTQELTKQWKELCDAERQRAATAIAEARSQVSGEMTLLEDKGRRLQAEVQSLEAAVSLKDAVVEGLKKSVETKVAAIRAKDAECAALKKALDAAGAAGDATRLARSNMSQFMSRVAGSRAADECAALVGHVVDGTDMAARAVGHRTSWALAPRDATSTAPAPSYYRALWDVVVSLLGDPWDPARARADMDAFRTALACPVPEQVLAWTPHAVMDAALARLDLVGMSFIDRLAAYELLLDVAHCFPSEAATSKLQMAYGRLNEARPLADMLATGEPEQDPDDGDWLSVPEHSLRLLIVKTLADDVEVAVFDLEARSVRSTPVSALVFSPPALYQRMTLPGSPPIVVKLLSVPRQKWVMKLVMG